MIIIFESKEYKLRKDFVIINLHQLIVEYSNGIEKKIYGFCLV
jgi:hypothetical protein